jgi:hypothetical protein
MRTSDDHDAPSDRQPAGRVRPDVDLADAAAVVRARQEVDAVLARMAVQPFDETAHGQMRRWLHDVGPAVDSWRRLQSGGGS